MSQILDCLPWEIWDAICSFLQGYDILRFRLVCSLFSQIGMRHRFREITFYSHESDFAELQRIANDHALGTCVESLVYIAHDFPDPVFTLRPFRLAFRETRGLVKRVSLPVDPDIPPTHFPEPLTNKELNEQYRRYAAFAMRQYKMLESKQDVSTLAQVIPKLPNLNSVTMSSSHYFSARQRKTPFDDMVLRPKPLLLEGYRPLDVLLSTLAESNTTLTNLQAGLLSFAFFNRDFATLLKQWRPLALLKQLDLVMDIQEKLFYRGVGPLFTMYIGRELLPSLSGVKPENADNLRNLLQTMSKLEFLSVVLNYTDRWRLKIPPRIENIISPGHTWPNLRSLTLGNIVCSRHDLMDRLLRHKGSLKHLCLQDVSLENTSWVKLLPEIRGGLKLESARMCGKLRGTPEPPRKGHEVEEWEFSVLKSEKDEIRDKIDAYCCNKIPDQECPLAPPRHESG